MKGIFKFLAVVLAVSLLTVVMSTSIFAADPKILMSFKGSEGGLTGGDATTGALHIKPDMTGHIWGYYVKIADVGVNPGDIIKIAFTLKINSIDEAAGSLRLNPFFTKGEGEGVGEYWADFEALDFDGSEGKTVIVVGVYTVPEEAEIMEGRIWHNAGIDMDVLEVTYATNGYNFQGYKGHDMVDERADSANDTNAYDNMETADGPSWKDGDAIRTFAPATSAPASTDPATDKPSKPEQPTTGDASMIITMVLAAAAGLGGLKFRNK